LCRWWRERTRAIRVESGIRMCCETKEFASAGEFLRECRAATGRKHPHNMSTVREYQCEICQTVTQNPLHWFVIQCADDKLTVHKWHEEIANSAGVRHFCGEGHAQVFISRWFDSVCTPPKPAAARH
jgi:hypothetical protein